MSKVITGPKLTNVSQIVSIFAIISETVSSPPTRIKWIYYPCAYKVARIWWPWYFARSQKVLNCLHTTWRSAWTCGWIMLRLSKIWLENAQLKLTWPSPHFSVTRDIKMLKFLCTACLHHIRTRQKKSLHLGIILTCLQNGTCMIE